MAHPKYWRSLDEYAGIRKPQEDLNEAPPPDEASRRRFIQVMGASFALAGAAACTRQPPEFIVPYVEPPERAIPGRPVYFASAAPVNGIAEGVIVETHLGRPTKIEGNPGHPASLGATSVHSQSCVLDLYDPGRARTITELGDARSWQAFLSALRIMLEPIRGQQGQGLSLLTETVTSPTYGAQIQALLKALPRAKWHQYDPAGMHSARAGSSQAFGQPVNTTYRLDRADIVLALDSNFLACGPGSTRYAHDFAMRRKRGSRLDMNRLYSVESTMTATGGKADHRLPLKYRDVAVFTRELAATVGVGGVNTPGTSINGPFMGALSRDLLAHRGASAVIAGEHQSPEVHAMAHAINAALGNAGTTVVYTDPLDVQPMDQINSLRDLVKDIDAGSVEVLLILGGNPVYNAPADLDFAAKMRKVKTRIRAGLHNDETSVLCQWHIPEKHFLEDWGDTRAYDGTVSIMQPMINPMYDAHAYIEILDAMLQFPGRDSYQIVRGYWSGQHKGADFENWWRKSVHDGWIENSALAEITPRITAAFTAASAQESAGGMELNFRADPYIYDGRFANNSWLQELPHPMTKLTWDNAVHMSPATAQRLGIENQRAVTISNAGRTVTGSVWITTGQPDDSVTVHLGYGRSNAGETGNGAGFNAYAIRRSDHPWAEQGVQIYKTSSWYPLATTQMQQDMEGRNLVISNTVDGYRKEPDFVSRIQEKVPTEHSLYPPWTYNGYAWAMSIDLTACVNCNACVVACQAENNIPVVGKAQVLGRRAMHWLRIDVYYQGDPANPAAYYEPVPCMQCEDAPCELVCPVQATNHSSDGLNDMIYNRCIGTRYCSNNCPYKVRRFNFFLFQDWTTETLKLQRNPDVTVRARGVMEKCTYCVQRIREGEIRASDEDRGIRDGEVQTACQQACPTQAIVFGDGNGKTNRVAQLKAEKLNYQLLAELNTRPRTSYLAELRNPNPQLGDLSRGDD
jgi:Fe-S-cluster-containing dehydrogenase component/anaerobic selenocysteine-containing dehydrogenase